jgi:hypothetical protein
MKDFMPFVFHLDAAILDRGHFDGDDRAALHAVDGVGERVAVDRLDRERDTLLVGVDLGDHGLDHVALAVVADHVLAPAFPGQVGEVHHAVDVVVETHEQTELGDVLDLALDLRADRELLSSKTSHGLRMVCLRPSDTRRLAVSISSTMTSTS